MQAEINGFLAGAAVRSMVPTPGMIDNTLHHPMTVRPDEHGSPLRVKALALTFGARRLLLVNHHRFDGRTHLTALLSEDDGATWPASLLLDARRNVSYPDGVEAGDGRIFVIYDRERQKEREILLAVFREADVLQGRCVSADTRLKQVVNRAGRAARA